MKTTKELRKTIVDLTVQLQKKNQEIDWLRKELEYARGTAATRTKTT